MAVVTRYGSGYKDPASLKAIDAVFAQATLRCISSHIDVANGDSATSIYNIGKVPSNAIIDPSSTMYYSAITGLTSLDVGFGQNGAVVNAKGNALVSAQTVAAAGNTSLVAAVAAGSLVKQAWQLAGYTADPGGTI